MPHPRGQLPTDRRPGFCGYAGNDRNKGKAQTRCGLGRLRRRYREILQPARPDRMRAIACSRIPPNFPGNARHRLPPPKPRPESQSGHALLLQFAGLRSDAGQRRQSAGREGRGVEADHGLQLRLSDRLARRREAAAWWPSPSIQRTISGACSAIPPGGRNCSSGTRSQASPVHRRQRDHPPCQGARHRSRRAGQSVDHRCVRLHRARRSAPMERC